MNPQVKKIADAVMGLLVIGVVVGGFYYLYKTRTKPKRNRVEQIHYWDATDEPPVNGIERVSIKGNVYVIKVEIDSVYKDKDEAPEPND